MDGERIQRLKNVFLFGWIDNVVGDFSGGGGGEERGTRMRREVT